MELVEVEPFGMARNRAQRGDKGCFGSSLPTILGADCVLSETQIFASFAVRAI